LSSRSAGGGDKQSIPSLIATRYAPYVFASLFSTASYTIQTQIQI
jgi:hypothetical protein